MKQETIKKIIPFLLLTLALSSCKISPNNSEQDKLFYEAVGLSYSDGLEITNSQLQSLDAYGVIQILIKNETDQCLTISYDKGIRLFSNIDGKWVKIQNLVINESPDDRLPLDPKGGSFPATFVATKPDFSLFADDEKPKNIRVLVLANPCQDPNSNTDMVGGYINLDLAP